MDAFLKKYFLPIVLLLVALMAYFQARGISALVGSALRPAAASLTTGNDVTAPTPVQTGVGHTNAEAIRSRNPFDSVTGPLIERPDAGLIMPVATGLENPLAAPDCGGPRVSIVSESEAPLSSMAAIQATGDGKVEIVHVGDRVGERVVAFIGYNPLRRTPAVWLAQGAAICQALLFSPAAAASPPAAEPAAQVAPAPIPAPAPTSDVPVHMRPVDQSLASQIRQIKEGETVVSKGAVDQVLEHREALMPDTRIWPEKENDRVVGIRIFGIRPETLLGKLGFYSGDRFESINGAPVTSPDDARRAYDALRNGPVQVKITRRGQPMTVTVRPE